MTQYIGNELDLFALAVNWKRYLRSRMAPYLRGNVLEVGAGIGGTTAALRGSEASWTCVEPDAALADRLRGASSHAGVTVVTGTIDAVPASARYDCILYVDVLEHIEDDAGEMRKAAARLMPSGTIVVLAPAHQSLYTPFDRALGHYRRYSKASLAAAAPADLPLVRLEYLDTAGWLLTFGNRVALKSASPTRAQILMWDRVFVPLSRVLDPLVGRSLGKSVLGVWRQTT